MKLPIFFKDCLMKTWKLQLFLQQLTLDAVSICKVASNYFLDEEIKAVKVMHEGSKKFPVPYELLLVQADFLRSKKQYEKALRLAKLAATRAPSEFHVWAKLATIFIDMEDYESVSDFYF